MTINLQSLRCNECGSTVFNRTGPNQYACQHCQAVSLVEDNVSERLDQVLEQVKDAAAERLAAEQSVRGRQTAKGVAVVIGAVAVLGVIVGLVGAFTGSKRNAGGSRPAVASLLDRSISPDGLKLTDARQVLVGSGSSMRPKLLVIARNETGKSLSGPSVQATLYDGDSNVGERRESVSVGVLQAGESAPLLIDLPGNRNVTRQDLVVQRLSEPARAVAGEVLRFAKVRLVAQGTDVRLVGRLRNPLKDQAIAGAQVLVTLYDHAGAVIGFGRGYAQGNALKAGEQSTVEVRLERFGGKAAVAAWDYRIGYELVQPDGNRAPVIAPERVLRTVGGPEALSPELRQSLDDLLAADADRFDLAQIELLPLSAGRDNTQRLLYLTELVNRSKDTIAVTPAVLVSEFDGSRAGGTTLLGRDVAYLYPGERLPVAISPKRADRITQVKTEWKPMRRVALPGARVPLEVRVTGTEAKTSSVLVNFSQRFTYRYADVRGTVTNPGTTMVRKVTLWVSLRDREGKLTGFKRLDDLPAIPSGETVPFEAGIEQWGRDFASVETLYQTE